MCYPEFVTFEKRADVGRAIYIIDESLRDLRKIRDFCVAEIKRKTEFKTYEDQLKIDLEERANIVAKFLKLSSSLEVEPLPPDQAGKKNITPDEHLKLLRDGNETNLTFFQGQLAVVEEKITRGEAALRKAEEMFRAMPPDPK